MASTSAITRSRGWPVSASAPSTAASPSGPNCWKPSSSMCSANSPTAPNRPWARTTPGRPSPGSSPASPCAPARTRGCRTPSTTAADPRWPPPPPLLDRLRRLTELAQRDGVLRADLSLAGHSVPGQGGRRRSLCAGHPGRPAPGRTVCHGRPRRNARTGEYPTARPALITPPYRTLGCHGAADHRDLARASGVLLDLPWNIPLEEWPDEHLVALPRGISRHVVRFARAGDEVVAVKEVGEWAAVREYGLLRDLDRLGGTRRWTRSRW